MSDTEIKDRYAASCRRLLALSLVLLVTACSSSTSADRAATTTSPSPSEAGQPSPIGEPTTPSSESPTVQESAESPASIDAFLEALDAILAQVPGWADSWSPYPTGYDYAFNGPCSGNWDMGATGGRDGGAGSADGMGSAHWPTAAQASDAAARLVGNLASCTATEWRTQPIAQQPGAVLASSADAVTWIQQMGTDVLVLQVRTIDGPPPVGVQVEVAEWMVEFIAWQNGWTVP